LGITLIYEEGRPLGDLRITLTHVCNFSCFFCHMEGEGFNKSPRLSPYEIYLFSKASYQLGIKNIKLTGGEPTARADLLEIVRLIRSISDEIDLSMTTNGFTMNSLAYKLKEGGLNRINISHA